MLRNGRVTRQRARYRSLAVAQAKTAAQGMFRRANPGVVYSNMMHATRTANSSRIPKLNTIAECVKPSTISNHETPNGARDRRSMATSSRRPIVPVGGRESPPEGGVAAALASRRMQRADLRIQERKGSPTSQRKGSPTSPVSPWGLGTLVSTAPDYAVGGTPEGYRAALQADSWTEIEVAATRHATYHWAAASVLKLESSDGDVRKDTMEALGRVPVELLATHEAAVVDKLDDPDEMVRFYATMALLKMPVEVVATHAGAIADRLDDENKDVRKYAMVALGKLPLTVLTTHQAAIAKMLEDPNDGVRREAIQALGRLPAKQLAEQHTAALVSRLDDAYDRVRVCAMQTVGKLPQNVLAASAAIIVARLEDKDARMRMYAMQALNKLSPEELTPHAAALVARLDDSSERVRTYAKQALAKLETAMAWATELVSDELLSALERARK